MTNPLEYSHPKSKLHSKRKWWVRQFLEEIEYLSGPTTAAAGRSLYRKNKVNKRIIFEESTIRSKVRGSHGGSYTTELYFPKLQERQWKELAIQIAQNSSFYLQFCENKLAPELEQVRDEQGQLLIGISDALEGGCDCWDYGTCKHQVALAHSLAKVAETDLEVYFQTFGVNYNDFVSYIQIFRSSDSSGESDTLAVSKVDSFGWPLHKEMAKVTSTRTYWKTPLSSQENTKIFKHSNIEVDIGSLIPKNRISGKLGSLTGVIQKMYEVISNSQDDTEE